MYRKMLSLKYILTVCLIMLSLSVCSSKKAKYSKKLKTTTTVPCESTQASYSTEVSTNSATDEWMPYSYSYTASVESDGDSGMIAAAQSGDSDGVVTGSYSLEASNGQMRQVIYKADKSGFHATVKTNEQGTANENPADVHIISTYDGNSETQTVSGYDDEETAESTSTDDYYAETTEAATKSMCICKMTTEAPVTKAPVKKCRCYAKKPQRTTTKKAKTKPYKRPKPKPTTKAPYKKKMPKTTTKRPAKKYKNTKKPSMTTKKPKYEESTY